MFKKLLGLSLIVLAVAAQEKAPPAPRRIALVIGNSEYASLPKLPAVKPGTAVIEAALRGTGFEILPVADFRSPGVPHTERKFDQPLRAGDICFVYYAGYAVQAENDNFLLPVNFDPRSKRRWRIAPTTSSGCRRDWNRTAWRSRSSFWMRRRKSISRSRSQRHRPDAARPFRIAGDGFRVGRLPGPLGTARSGGAASPFTRAVAKAIRERGLTLAQVFDVVQQDKALPRFPT